MLKQNKRKLILTTILILLPALVGLLLWDRLPDQIPTHWNAAGEVDGWSSKALAVFGLPAFLVVIHWVCMLVTASDRKNEKQSAKVTELMFWICPVIALLSVFAVYGAALGMELDMATLPFLLLGPLFMIIGNYLPKCRHNYTIGIKLPWTFASEENWNATHRFAGRIWVIGGVLLMLGVFLPEAWRFWSMMGFILFMVGLPTAYSWRYAQKHR